MFYLSHCHLIAIASQVVPRVTASSLSNVPFYLLERKKPGMYLANSIRLFVISEAVPSFDTYRPSELRRLVV